MIPENHEQVIQDFMAFIECPINCVSMESAAITHHGHLFEHNTINNYLSSRKWNMWVKESVCPITRQPLEKSQVVEFSALNKLLSYLKSDGKTCLSDDEKESISTQLHKEKIIRQIYDTQIKNEKNILRPNLQIPHTISKIHPAGVLKAYL